MLLGHHSTVVDSPVSLATSSTVPLASLMAVNAVLRSPASSALDRMPRVSFAAAVAVLGGCQHGPPLWHPEPLGGSR